MRLGRTVAAAFLIGIAFLSTTVSAAAGPPQSTAARSEASAVETGMAKTLAANPGSTRLSDNQIRLAPGVELEYPNGTGEVQPAALLCPSGYFCLYVDSNYRGPVLRFYHCGRVGLDHYVFYNPWMHHWDHNVSSAINSQNVPARLEFGWGGVMVFRPYHSMRYLRGDYNDSATVVDPC
jgi:hypothetical protein